ncbi:hypothetical protein C7M84_016163 [Penaeus vannamei]|uniref:Uncharacterized protein n=1 Tax=Penaeus vannamei TaxID=6689 RepID=A0A3R7Q148_PENVA|nr:hypothetical protein C7M84_016163 [Penaeus vannamei]
MYFIFHLYLFLSTFLFPFSFYYLRLSLSPPLSPSPPPRDFIFYLSLSYFICHFSISFHPSTLTPLTFSLDPATLIFYFTLFSLFFLPLPFFIFSSPLFPPPRFFFLLSSFPSPFLLSLFFPSLPPFVFPFPHLFLSPSFRISLSPSFRISLPSPFPLSSFRIFPLSLPLDPTPTPLIFFSSRLFPPTSFIFLISLPSLLSLYLLFSHALFPLFFPFHPDLIPPSLSFSPLSPPPFFYLSRRSVIVFVFSSLPLSPPLFISSPKLLVSSPFPPSRPYALNLLSLTPLFALPSLCHFSLSTSPFPHYFICSLLSYPPVLLLSLPTTSHIFLPLLSFPVSTPLHTLPILSFPIFALVSLSLSLSSLSLSRVSSLDSLSISLSLSGRPPLLPPLSSSSLSLSSLFSLLFSLVHLSLVVLSCFLLSPQSRLVVSLSSLSLSFLLLPSISLSPYLSLSSLSLLQPTSPPSMPAYHLLLVFSISSPPPPVSSLSFSPPFSLSLSLPPHTYIIHHHFHHTSCLDRITFSRGPSKSQHDLESFLPKKNSRFFLFLFSLSALSPDR